MAGKIIKEMTLPQKILVLNGPNLNMLGTREPEIYGRESLSDIEDLCAKTAKSLKMQVECLQSNYEGELVTLIQKSIGQYDGIIINAAAYTHTSIAIYDALKLCGLPVIEVHLSNIYARDTFRHKSYISPLAKGVLCGFGVMGYSLALQAMKNELNAGEKKDG